MVSLTLELHHKLYKEIQDNPEQYNLFIDNDKIILEHDNNNQVLSSIQKFAIFNPEVISWRLNNNQIKINLTLNEPVRNNKEASLSFNTG